MYPIKRLCKTGRLAFRPDIVIDFQLLLRIENDYDKLTTYDFCINFFLVAGDSKISSFSGLRPELLLTRFSAAFFRFLWFFDI